MGLLHTEYTYDLLKFRAASRRRVAPGAFNAD
jgi:hypothetical protein